MRPVRLELEGFFAFKERTVVDFADADLFALTGPIGSGKSSVIDAMVFALFGCVPRLDRKSVAPLVHLSATEARVRLDFVVGGVGYTAARVVRRSGKGASTKEARLERSDDGTVLAGNERELSTAVEGILGLGFDHFTKCVVLPQGAFQRFLHAHGGERQDLLVKLLGLDLYERMAGAARSRGAAAGHEAGVAEALVEKLAFATPDALAAAAARVERLEALARAVVALRPRLDQLVAEEAAARAEGDEAARRAQVLDGVSVPEGLADFGSVLADAAEAVTTLETELERAEGHLVAADAEVGRLPDRRRLEAAEAAHRDRDAAVERRSAVGPALAEAVATEATARAEVAQGEAAVAVAELRLDAARDRARAHELAAGLAVGAPCPVCRRDVAELPELGQHPGELDEARAALAAVQADRQQAEVALAGATGQHTRLQARAEGEDERIQEADGRLSEAPDLAAIATGLAAIDQAEAAVTAARRATRSAGKEAQQARQVLAGLQEREAAARRSFERTRAEIIPLGAPQTDGGGLLSEWEALAAWAGDQVPIERAAAESATQRAGQAAQQRAAQEADLAQQCADAEVAVGAAGPGDAVVAAVARAQAEAERIDRAIEDAAGHRRDADAHRRAALVAGELARHLQANNFEKWILDEALSGLVARATELLRDLSAGAYSLTLEPGTSNFAVIDHRNADQRRSARTLSGGETFLASLALALALADQLGELAAEGSPRLESIFLDEGFGTLDPDTLDTVATAIEELGSQGRMVGLISHIPELAERVPVRFEVTRGPATSTIEKVLA